MKKNYIFYLLMLVFAVSVSAQTYDFESYTVGGKLAQQAGAPWTTWSNAPGGAEDPVISSTQAHGGTKSVNVVNDNDLVYSFSDITTGRKSIEWYMYVPTGKVGYTNFLSDFNAANSIWAFQFYVKTDSIYVDADGYTAAKYPFAYNTWVKLKLIVDLDDDFATFYVGTTEVISYTWSRGSGGTDDSHKLDGINFYGWDGTDDGSGSAGSYFIDDITIADATVPAGPTNLTATLNGSDIDLTWTAPTTTPDNYKLSRNNYIINSTLSGTSYTDLDPWPNTYNYIMRAHFNGQGYSPSNVATETRPGGVTRNFVLIEGTTYLTCPYCPGAAMGIHDLIDVNNKDAVAIEYHSSSDSYNNAAATARISYYGVTGHPTVMVDGVEKHVGGSATTSLYPVYLEMYNKRAQIPAIHICDVNITETSANNYSAEITVEQTFAEFSSGLKLRTALTESNIIQSWGNQTEIDYACRGMYPDAGGTTLDFSTGNTQTVTVNFSTTGYVKNNCEFIAFVQHDPSKEITQTAKVDMSSITGIEELQGKQISVYPNPASDYVMVLNNGKGNLEIFDITGQLVYSNIISNPTQMVDLSKFNKGVYILNVSDSENNFTKKLVIE